MNINFYRTIRGSLVASTESQAGPMALVETQQIAIIVNAPAGFNRNGIYVRRDGNGFYILNDNDDKIYGWNMSIPFSLTSESYSQASGVISTNWGSTADAIGLAFKDDGTKVYSTSLNYDTLQIFEHSLSTAWDLSTISASPVEEITLAGYNSSYRMSDINFSSDGTIMYVQFQTLWFSSPYQSQARAYPLGTAWDISTASTYSSVTLEDTVNGDYYYANTMQPIDPADSSKGYLTSYRDYNQPTAEYYVGYHPTYNNTESVRFLLEATSSLEMIDAPSSTYVFTVDAAQQVRRYSWTY